MVDNNATVNLPDSELKIVVVGDGAVGKTCLLMSYIRNEFPRDYVPTIFDCQFVNDYRYGRHVKVNLWDTAGQDDYDHLRPLSYHSVDIYLLCFSIGMKASLENVKLKWKDDLKKHDGKTPIILVGLQKDLREDSTIQNQLTSFKDGKDMAKAIGALKYMECSAWTRDGIHSVFNAAIDYAMNTPKKTFFKCTLL